MESYPQIFSGIHPIERWPNGDIFWTNGLFVGFLKSFSKENTIEINLLTGKKQDKLDLYEVKIELVNNNDQEIIAKKEYVLSQSNWHTIKIKFDAIRGINEYKLVIISDSYIPWDLDESIDSRELGVAVKNILLK